MNETLQTFAEYTAERRAAAAAALRAHAGEKGYLQQTTDAMIKITGGKDRIKLKKYLPDPENEHGKKYRSSLWKYWRTSSESDKLKMIAFESPALKLLASFPECEGLTQEEMRLAARAIATDLYRELGRSNQFVVRSTVDEKKHKGKTQEVLLNTLWAEVERERSQGFDFEQISGMLKAITKNRLHASAAKIADEYYKRHPEQAPKNRKAAP
jgi:hypothetical protein